MHRVFCSTPGDLESERLLFHNVVAEVTESEGMPRQTLLVPVTCLRNEHLLLFRKAVEENVRQCAYFVQVLNDSWGMGDSFKGLYPFAAACRDNPNEPMQEMAVFIKGSGSGKSLLQSIDTPGVPVFIFNSNEEFTAGLRTLLTQWIRSATVSETASA